MIARRTRNTHNSPVYHRRETILCSVFFVVVHRHGGFASHPIKNDFEEQIVQTPTKSTVAALHSTSAWFLRMPKFRRVPFVFVARITPL